MALDQGNTCGSRSGTSCSAAIVCGAVAVAISSLRGYYPQFRANAGMLTEHNITFFDRVKKALMDSSITLGEYGMNEQGFGKLSFDEFVKTFTRMGHELSASSNPQRFAAAPRHVNLTVGNPYFFPYSAQPLYATGVPIVFTEQVLGLKTPQYEIRRCWLLEGNSSCIQASCSRELPRMVSGYVGLLEIELEVRPSSHCENRARVNERATVVVELADRSVASTNSTSKAAVESRRGRVIDSLNNVVKIELSVDVISRPHRKYRVLWDEYHLWGNDSAGATSTYEETSETLYHKYIKVPSRPLFVGV